MCGVLEAAECLFCSRSASDAKHGVEVFRSSCPSRTAPLEAPPGLVGTRQSDCGPTALSPGKTPRQRLLDNTVALFIFRFDVWLSGAAI